MPVAAGDADLGQLWRIPNVRARSRTASRIWLIAELAPAICGQGQDRDTVAGAAPERPGGVANIGPRRI
jgi:hypothetical protein